MATYRTSPRVMSQVLDSSTILLDVERGLYFRLNGTATLVWEGLLAAQAVDGIVTRIARACELAPDVVRPDVDALLESLVEQGLVARS